MEIAEILAKLKAFFYEDEIEHKVQVLNREKTKAMVVPYINARAIMDRLDSTVGAENWQDAYRPGASGGVICALSLRINGEWVTKEDGADNSDQDAVKGGISNSFKRAAVKWGIGRYLYDVPKVWVEVDEKKLPKVWPKIPRQFLPADAAPVTGFRPVARVQNAEKGENKPATEKTKAAATKVVKPAAEKVAETPAPPAAEKVPGDITDQMTHTDKAVAMEWALGHNVIPGTGVPSMFDGKPLKEVKSDKLGLVVMAYLAGVRPNQAGVLFAPTDKDLVELQQCAKLVYEDMPKDQPQA